MEKKKIFSRYLALWGVVILIALGLVATFFSALQAQEGQKDWLNQKSRMTLMQVVQKYEDQGYSRLGPLHVTNPPQDGSVDFYRHSPVRYDEIRILDQKGKRAVLDRNARVYLLQKGGRVILIRLNREDRSDAH